MSPSERASPLTPAVFHILFALGTGPKHGYQMMSHIRQDSQERVKMGPGTLYGSIKRMLAAGLIEEAGNRSDPKPDNERRRYYRLTALGRRALVAELRRYDALLSLSHRRRLFPDSPAKKTI
jgi:DNA-binding PadR family transcriptional regulator